MSTATVAGPTGTSMRGLLGAQLTMLRTRSTVITFAVSVLVPLAGLVLLLSLGQQTFDITGADLARPLTESIGDYVLLAPLLGALIAGSQHRHATIVPTLLAEPRRVRVAASIMLVAGAAAAASAVACALLGGAVALPWLASQGVPTGEVLADPDLWWRAAGQVAATTATGVLGAALGILLRGVLGPVLVLIGLRIAEVSLAQLLPGDWTHWTHSFNLDAVADLTVPDLPVPVWHPVVHLLAVVAAVVTAALVGASRRDTT